MKQKLISGVTLTVLLVLVALPLLFIVLQAIFPHFSAGSLSGALTGVPMLFADPQLLPMLGGTLWVACGVALMSVVIGLPLGVLRGLFNVPLPRLWDLLFLIPFLTPPYIAALSWMLVLQSNGYLQQLTGWDLNDLLFSRGGIVLVMTFNIFPVVYFAVSRSLLASGQRLAIVARVHGASAWRAFWHITLPVLATVIGGFAALTMLTKNSFLDEIRKQYVVTARAKGVGETQILWGHVFRNAMLLVIAGFPAMFISMFFTGSLLIEVMFSLNGLGLLGYEATVSRDYPVMFGTLYIFTLIGLLLNIVSDICYTLVDPRIDFEGR